MKLLFKPTARALLLSVTTAALLTTPVSADCTYELFNIASVKGTSVGEFIDQISDECGMSVIVADSEAENILKKQMNKTYLKNLTINEVLDLIVKENGLQYTLSNNVLKLSHLQTKTYNIDYIISTRIGKGSTDITLSSNTSTSNTASTATTGTTTSTSGGGSAESTSGMKITSDDQVTFWEALDQELESVLNRPEDTYISKRPTINKNAGLITVTATGKQIARLDNYLEDLQKKMQTQVMIDVKMYGVVFDDSKTTGVDWQQLYSLTNGSIGFNTAATSGIASGYELTPSGGGDFITTATGSGKQSSVFQLSVGGSINEVIKFLKTQGDLYAISNPKIMTLNNQPALITSGTELFYKTINTSTLAGGTTGEQSVSEVISSVFAGVLLDITPEISKDGRITLRINPSISEPASQVNTDGATRTMPPDLTRRQISSVITVQDGGRVILGGLINVKNVDNSSHVPILGDIPLLSYLFKRESMVKKTEEIVMIIEPHIVKKEGDNLTLGDIGFSRIVNAVERDKVQESLKLKEEQKVIAEMKEDAKQ